MTLGTFRGSAVLAVAFFVTTPVFSQVQGGNLDSLVGLLEANDGDQQKVELLNQLADAYNRKPSKFAKDSSYMFSKQAESLARQIGYTSGIAQALYDLGKFEIGVKRDPSKATPKLLESLSLFESQNDSVGVSNCYMQLGLISYILEYFEDAIKNFKLSVSFVDNGTSNYLMALSYTELDSFPAAKEYFSKSIEHYRSTGNSHRLGESFLYLGRMFLKMDQLDSAFHYFHQVIRNARTEPDSNSLIRPYAFIAEAYLKSNDIDNAVYFAERSYDLETSNSNAIRDEISLIQSAWVLSKAHEIRGDYKQAHFFLDLYSTENSLLADGSTKQKIADMRSMFDFDKKFSEQRIRQQKDKEIAEAKIQKERILRNSFIIGSVLLLLLLIGLYHRFRFKRKANEVLQQKNRIISEEKKRSDDLLLNILPEEVAEELKLKGEAEAKRIDDVTVLFTDFKEFTNYSERVTAEELVHDLHECFSEFDKIIAKHGMEKIKTIGDAYMAAGGLPAPNGTHANDSIAAALEIRDFIEAGKSRKIEAGLPFFEIRIGIHTGPVVAGIVGVWKFSYDIWGDTVNTAARLESSGVAGRVNISEATHALVRGNPEWSFTPRGKINAKGKGAIDMYFVEKG